MKPDLTINQIVLDIVRNGFTYAYFCQDIPGSIEPEDPLWKRKSALQVSNFLRQRNITWSRFQVHDLYGERYMGDTINIGLYLKEDALSELCACEYLHELNPLFVKAGIAAEPPSWLECSYLLTHIDFRKLYERFHWDNQGKGVPNWRVVDPTPDLGIDMYPLTREEREAILF